MTPADLRALAERVERSQAPNDEIAIALGWRMTGDYRGISPRSGMKKIVPDYDRDLNAIAAAWELLRAKGWELSLVVNAEDNIAVGYPPGSGKNSDSSEAKTLARAWLGLLLRVMAAEMEAAHD